MSDQPWCCIIECENDAEFEIFGDSNHYEDSTEACEDHVGALLGTPDWLMKMRGRETKEWTVVPIARDHHEVHRVLPIGWHLEEGSVPATACYTANCENPHHVDDRMAWRGDADVANVAFGERYGIDWEYAPKDEEGPRMSRGSGVVRKTPCFSIVITEQGPNEAWLLNLDRYNSEDDIAIPPKVGRALLALIKNRTEEDAPRMEKAIPTSTCNCGHCVPHKSDCAVHNAPAYPPGRCDCPTGNPARTEENNGSNES